LKFEKQRNKKSTEEKKKERREAAVFRFLGIDDALIPYREYRIG